MAEERFFITGGQGFLGAWIVKQLLDEGASFVLFDLRPDDHILSQVLEQDALEGLERIYGDVSDTKVVLDAVAGTGATHIIHLAGLQVPTCRDDPLLGARVNVLGTLNLFEAARRGGNQVRQVVYASSAAVAGAPGDYSGPLADDARHVPRTHYGVFKTANEGNARVYWLDHGIPSVGLRPLTVYGVGRELGITSGPTKAIKAAVLGKPFTVPFSGPTGFDLASDVASIFVSSARTAAGGALALNLRGVTADVAEFVAAVEEEIPEAKRTLGVDGPLLPVAYDFLEAGLDGFLPRTERTPIVEGVRRTAAHFRRLHANGQLQAGDLEA